MNKQRMIRMLTIAKEAVAEVGLDRADDAGFQNLVGQLILASAIEESGSSVSLSLDKLERVAVELGDVATAIRQSS